MGLRRRLRPTTEEVIHPDTTRLARGVDLPNATRAASQEEIETSQRIANETEFAKQVPEPYILGPQAYSDPNVWIPEGAKDPLVDDEQYTETLEFIDKMDALADSL